MSKSRRRITGILRLVAVSGGVRARVRTNISRGMSSRSTTRGDVRCLLFSCAAASSSKRSRALSSSRGRTLGAATRTFSSQLGKKRSVRAITSTTKLATRATAFSSRDADPSGSLVTTTSTLAGRNSIASVVRARGKVCVTGLADLLSERTARDGGRDVMDREGGRRCSSLLRR